MEIAGKTLRHRLLVALAVLVVLSIYDYATAPSINWTINLLVSVLYILFSLAIDAGLERWRAGQE